MQRTIQLFITCLIDTLQPHIGDSVVHVLQKAGVRVEFPKDQTCCGQPAFNAGLRSDAVKMAKHTIEVFENTEGDIVIPSGSCTAMVRHNYPELFKDDPAWEQRADAIAERSYEFSEYLVNKLGITDIDRRLDAKLTYHASCHLLRDLGVDHQPRELLTNVEGAKLTPLQEETHCCGFGGVFSVVHPEVSAAMLERKMNNIQASGADLAVVCDAGCMLHINGGLHRNNKPANVRHIAEILDDRRDPGLGR